MGETFVRAVALAMLGLTVSSPSRAQAREVKLEGSASAWFSADDYPPDALRVGAQGPVLATLAIDSTGAVSACSILVSSGNAALDKATCDLALHRGHFIPARDRKGRPTAATYLLPVRWTLPNDPMDVTQMPAHTDVATGIFVSAKGIIASCIVMDRKGIPDTADPCSAYKPGDEEQVLEKDGRPVSYKLVRRVIQDVVLGD